MFSRNKRQQNAAPIKPPVRSVPKEPVLAGRPLSARDEGLASGQQPVPSRGDAPKLGQDAPVTSSSKNKSENSSTGASSPFVVASSANATASSVQARGESDSVMSSKISVVGNMVTSGSLSFNGRIQGDIVAEEFELGSEGVVDGVIRAQRVSISGVVNGAIVANDVSLTSSAKMNGDIEHRALSIESGAELNGAVRRGDDPLKGADDDEGHEDDAQSAPAIELGGDSVVEEKQPQPATDSANPTNPGAIVDPAPGAVHPELRTQSTLSNA